MDLITDPETIRKEIGLRLEENLLIPRQNLDTHRDAFPILIKSDSKKYYLLLKEIETGNISPGGAAWGVIRKRRVKVILYGPYFTWDKVAKGGKGCPPDEIAPLSKAFKVKEFRVYPDMTLDRFRRLSRAFDLVLDASRWGRERIRVYTLSRKKQGTAIPPKRSAIGRWALKTVNRHLELSAEDRKTVEKILRRPWVSPLKVLDDLMEEKGLGSMLASSPINIQALTGMPYDRIRNGILGLYTRGKVYLLSQKPLQGYGLKKEKEIFQSLREAVQRFAGAGPLGVEEKNLEVGLALPLGLNRLQNASHLFQTWREAHAARDLDAYILAAQATKVAVEGALAMAEKRLEANRPVYEKDVERKFHRLLKEYERQLKIPVKLVPHFTVLHAGIRTPYPSLPGNLRLTKKINSLKLDAGILLKDRGYILACCDLARSIVMDRTAKAFYDLLERAVLEAAIPAGKEGAMGEDVYWAGMRPLLREEKTLRGWKLLPPNGFLEKDHNRDIGHTFGKQESTTFLFKKGSKEQTLKSGMVAAIEYQWPYKGYAFGVEDMFVVGPQHGINITR